MSKTWRKEPEAETYTDSPPLWKGHTQVDPEVHLSKTGTKERVLLKKKIVKLENKIMFLSHYLFSPSLAFQCLYGKPFIVLIQCGKFR